MRVAVLFLTAFLLAVAIWAAGELHYRSCVNAAEARTPVAVVKDSGFGGAGTPVDKLTGTRARARAVGGCSRAPF
jgi:Na+-transporting methylmalonyl-CoA/oxaloacetate decarboxylase gamma subunit